MVEMETKIKVAERSRSYERYKDSGVAWLGEIPEHWEITRLANIGRFSSSGIDKLIKKNESLVKIINYTDVYKNLELIINSAINFMEVTTPESNRIKNLVKKGDLIFLPSSETLEDLGLSALVDEDIENLSFSYHVLRFEFTAEVAHRFKKYFTNNKKGLNEFSKKGTGSIRKTLGRNDFRNTIVTLPPLQEQTAIAQFLDDKTTKIDEAINIKQQQISLLKERKQILIHKAVTQGLNPNVKLKNSGVEWIGEIPEGWDLLPGFMVYKENKTKNHGMTENVVLSLSYGNIVIKPKEKLVGLVPESFETYQIVKPGDIIIRCMDLQNDKTSLRTGIAVNDGIITSAYLNLNIVNNNVSEYVYNFLHSLDTTKVLYKFGTGLRQNLSFGDFKHLQIPIPPKEEQETIVDYIENITQKIETAISLKQQEIAKLKEYKSSLINSVVTGKVKVC
ncbi:restriction endonuclease subunit S [Flavobacteriaceae bacterium]|nr:restriction endonuclease subunit S [Flavobacteriaceae bacterium]MDB9798488.1 restriction endonuclease subunit S [Flavobacteriaceae bacterium]